MSWNANVSCIDDEAVLLGSVALDGGVESLGVAVPCDRAFECCLAILKLSKSCS